MSTPSGRHILLQGLSAVSARTGSTGSARAVAALADRGPPLEVAGGIRARGIGTSGAVAAQTPTPSP